MTDVWNGEHEMTNNDAGAGFDGVRDADTVEMSAGSYANGASDETDEAVSARRDGNHGAREGSGGADGSYGYRSGGDEEAPGPAPYGRVPHDMPEQGSWNGPQPPSGPAVATIALSLLPLCVGVVALVVGIGFPIPVLPRFMNADPRALVALSLAVLGGLLIIVALVWGSVSLVRSHRAKSL
ncbi:hypothetical protein PT282_02265 [Bifidobacterium sp. ESL0763]|uniref:hypothetical protein n=1 Tax=Bifidobacterium sp. ESL0763 TaxID=2983227 RepID=UPI0023F989EA|nr:hypothetical protein [Bifidobacterium sp. ESL0763]MDF7663500.1 hypothetical protein [Bifidobacterium sp. ESL0763]